MKSTQGRVSKVIRARILMRDVRVTVSMLWGHLVALVVTLAFSTWYLGSIVWPDLSWHQAAYSVLRVIIIDPEVPYGDLRSAGARALYFALPLLTVIAGLDIFRRVFSCLVERRQRTREWECRTIERMKGHIVVCGLGAVGSKVVEQLCSRGLNLQIAAIQNVADKPGVDAARMRRG